MSTSVVHVCCGMLPFGQSIFTSFNSPPSIRKLVHPLEGFLVPLWDMAGPPLWLWLFSDSCVSLMGLAFEVFKLKWLWLPWWPSLETFEGSTFLFQCPSCHRLPWREHRWEWRLLSGTDLWVLPVGASPRTFAGLFFIGNSKDSLILRGVGFTGANRLGGYLLARHEGFACQRLGWAWRSACWGFQRGLSLDLGPHCKWCKWLLTNTILGTSCVFVFVSVFVFVITDW